MRKELKALIKDKIAVNEFNLKVFNIVREHVKKYEGKKYTRRYIPSITADITEVFGSGIFKYSGAMLDDSLSWKSIKLELNVTSGYSHSYQLHYDSQETVTLEEFDRLNVCWPKASETIEKLKRLLVSNELTKIQKNIEAINKANDSLNELFEYGTDASEIQYDIKDLLNVKLERK